MVKYKFEAMLAMEKATNLDRGREGFPLPYPRTELAVLPHTALQSMRS
jgi:hypothetical protein